MVTLKSSDLDLKALHRLLIGGIVPRPIALVSTQDPLGKTNVAPFSFFSGVCSNPPSLVISVASKPDGSKKDTLRNIEETKEFVVNSSQVPWAKQINECSAPLPHEESEFDRTGLTPQASQFVQPPRVKESLFQMECKLLNLVPVGDGSAGSSTLVIGEILAFHVSPEVYKEGKIELPNYQPLSRLGGLDYGEIGRVFSLPRPKV